MPPSSSTSGIEAQAARAAAPSSLSTLPPTPSQPPPVPQLESCVKYFDALWWCYSPGHQLRQFYRHGNVDDCSSSWKGVWDCLSARTVRYKEDADAAVEVAAVARATHPLWRLRTPEEAACWWKAGFGHLDGAPAEPAPGSHYPPPASGGGLHASGGEATP